MNEHSAIIILIGDLIVDFHTLHQEYGQWVKNKFAGIPNPPDADGICGLDDFYAPLKEDCHVPAKQYHLVVKYLDKCAKQYISKAKFIEQCIAMDPKHIPVYLALRKLNMNWTTDNTMLNKTVIDIVSSNPTFSIKDLVDKVRIATNKTIDARIVTAAVTSALTTERDVLTNTLDKMSAEPRLANKCNVFLTALERQIQTFNERLNLV